MGRGFTALIDGDIVSYRCAAAAQKTVYEVMADNDPFPIATYVSSSKAGEGASGAHAKVAELSEKYPSVVFSLSRRIEAEPLAFAISTAKAFLARVMDTLFTTDYHLYLSPPFCFRDDIATILEYKGNRDRDMRPIHYEKVREYMKQSLGAKEAPNNWEADDIISVVAREYPGRGYNVVVSNDKDLNQIPGYHYDPVKDMTFEVTPKESYEYLWSQILIGDRTDNILGLPGAGPVFAENLCKEAKNETDLMFKVQDAFNEKFKSDTDEATKWFVETGSLVYLLQQRDDSFVKHCERLSQSATDYKSGDV